MRFIVASFLCRDLRFEPAPLVKRIVQLGKGVGYLPRTDEELEPLHVPGPVVLRVSDENDLRYTGIRIKETAAGATRFVDGYNRDFVTGADGLMWLWWDDAGPGSVLEAEIEGVPASRISIER
jgi:hypothetical protein